MKGVHQQHLARLVSMTGCPGSALPSRTYSTSAARVWAAATVVPPADDRRCRLDSGMPVPPPGRRRPHCRSMTKKAAAKRALLPVAVRDRMTCAVGGPAKTHDMSRLETMGPVLSGSQASTVSAYGLPV